ncbi:MAG TPA: methyl-accepting chemotaxis protein [Leucothrix sp.]|nr:methyl-accepting chemotaxis protein [Leucothrix sp.]
MLNKLSINQRMLLLIILPTIVLTLTSFIAYNIITKNTQALEYAELSFETANAANEVNYSITTHYTQLLSNINAGFIYWKAAQQKTEEGIKEIKLSLNRFNNLLTKKEKSSTEIQLLLKQQKRIISSYDNFRKVFSSSENKNVLNTYVLEKMYPLANTLTSSMQQIGNRKYKESEQLISSTINSSKQTIQQSLLYILGGVVITLILGVLIMRSITNPTNNLTQVVQRLSQGEFDARAKIIGTDEFSKLSKAFNQLLDERANTLENTETEYQKLNQSVFKLLQTVAELSEKNLTIRAEVTEDATGPVADAINLFAEETAATLSQVRDVAAHVNQTSQIVNTHLMSVNKLAIKEQEQAIETTDQMDKMLQRLDAIATSATETNKMADNTKISTEKAHKYVSGTLDGMAEIRETVQETGRRIKVLGERSQEISHVIEIINSIAERTTVLALNASMQAVAAGDAGRGFSVIAEEIQRLAESSRDSTEQISTLVRNIQQETNTTIATMDKTIEQVINGSTRAEDAVQQMKEVLETTTQLIHSVDLIASASHEQVSISKNLKHKAQNILKSTQSTGQELLSLTGLSRKMAEYAQQLVHSVNVFTIDKNTPRRNSK